MRKKITLLNIFTILVTTNLNVIACKHDQFINNFYVLGDSLSDTGAGTFAQNQYLINDNESKFKHFELKKPYYHNCWSNGKVASQLIAEKFNIDFKPGWSFNINGKKYQKNGNNYAFGGEVADSSDNDNNLIKTFDLFHQVNMLLSQHQLQKNDFIWIEIAANDIGALMTKTDPLVINNKINNILYEEKKAIEILIKNGAKKLIISDVPDLTLTPKIKKKLANNKAKIAAAQKTCFYYQKQWKQMIINMQKKYNKIIIPYFLSKELAEDMNEFKNKILDGIVATSATSTKMVSDKLNYYYQPVFNAGVNKNNLTKYFYFDEFHPGIWFHQQMATSVINLIEKYW